MKKEELIQKFQELYGAEGDIDVYKRQILKTAYKAGMLDDEELWMAALISRKNVAHAYNEAIAMDIIRQTKDKYYEMFVQFEQTIEKDWM